MIVFDTLSELESYENAFHELRNVIEIMDRSLPYRQAEGSYECPENSNVTYTVEKVVTGDKGVPLKVPAGKKAVIITLEGEMVASSLSSDRVFILTEGRFLLAGEGEYRVGLSTNLPTEIKYCVFMF
ncbi:MAG: hypothetical protein ACI4NM_09375 [Bullifex sp.]